MKITSSSHTTAGMSVLVTLSLVEFDLACFVVAEGFTVLLYPFSVADEVRVSLLFAGRKFYHGYIYVYHMYKELCEKPI